MIKSYLIKRLLFIIPLIAFTIEGFAQDTYTINVDANKLTKVLSDNPIGINMDYLVDDDSYDPEGRTISTKDALKNLNVSMLRFPGGEKADNYLWSQSPFTSINPSLSSKGKCYFPNSEFQFTKDDTATLEETTLDFEEFMKLVDYTGAEPFIVVNGDGQYEARDSNCKGDSLASRSYLIKVAKAWVKYAKDHKYNIKYWMIGNESWNKTITAAQYRDDVIDFATAMKEADPDIKIVVNGKDLNRDNMNWWATLLNNEKAASLIDYLGISAFPVYVWDGYNDYKDGVPDLTKEIRKAKEAINNSAYARDRVRLLISETNSMDWGPFFEKGQGWTSWANDVGHALIAFDIIGKQIVDDKVDFTLFWTTRYFNYNYEFNLPIYNALSSDGSLQANGKAISLWGKYLLDKVGSITNATDGSYIVSYATKDENYLNVFLINKDDQNSKKVALNLNNFSNSGSASVSVFKGSSIVDIEPDIIESIGSIKADEGSNKTGFSITVDPASITVLQFSSDSLPVELVYFKAQRKNNDVELTWQTASERDNAGFEVQVSDNEAKSFRTLAFIKSSSGGNSMVPISYSFLDQEAGKSGSRYYRLKQTDFDGKVTYSAIKSVEFEVQDQKALVYPNPFGSSFNFSITSKSEEEVNISVVNTLGKVVLEDKVKAHAGENKIPVELGNRYAAGVYFLRVSSESCKQTFKILKR
ncbi:T9SS type A sorting domain-containing protein [Pontibacter silvestris]|uniref:T9SS type A sorting domain-containing protein n=1 Tax=Pontibacter silvestris TaxID=2305183 RepID=A0ABW4WX78_9BACT|nr:T9SS type A sorting domain-containing protein [Pontibacter silvestris]MCC9136710.1 T9SS type A sorting domain-containing protein [Pontibacter silvestris]